MYNIFTFCKIFTKENRLKSMENNLDRDKYTALMSQNLQILRLKANLSQEDLANLLGVTRQTISAIETGQRTMSWTVFLALFLLFLNNKETKQLLIALGIYTKEISKFINF